MIVDAFAGPGGWSVALALLGHADVGIEWDAAACQTRAAAGLLTIRADVSEYPTAPFRGKVRGFIGSPPCPAFSAAGKGHGTDLVPTIVDAVHRRDWSARPHPDPEVWLVIDLGRWLVDLAPDWITLEQVPAVLPIWRAYCHVLEQLGYSTWCGVLNAADFGVPQTRRRAILIADRRRPAGAPQPTHTQDPAPSLFDQLLPWTTMANALGWGMTERPAFTFTGASSETGGTRPDGVGGSGARAAQLHERDRGAWKVRTGQQSEQGGGVLIDYERSIDEPAPTLTSQSRSWLLNTGRDWKPSGDRADAQTIDPYSQPAPTFGARSAGQWQLNPGRTDAQPNRRTYDPDAEPAPTVAFGHDAANWCWERPATTLSCDPRVFTPGGHIAHDGRDNTKMKGRSEDAIRLEVVDALALQTFPINYPVAGSRTKQFEQVGNAIPPRLAWHILRTVLEERP